MKDWRWWQWILGGIFALSALSIVSRTLRTPEQIQAEAELLKRLQAQNDNGGPTQ